MKGAGILSAAKNLLGFGEVAPYEVVKEYEGFEERLYPARKWVTTTMEGPSRDALMNPMFMKLFGYISGDNSKNASIDMTTPVTTHVTAAGPSNFSFKMAFLVPEAHMADTPTGGEDIVIEDRPETRVLTRRFGGYATDDVVAKETQELADVIKASGQTDVVYDVYYIVGYNPPFKPIGRRNEIWYLKTVAVEPQAV